MILCCAMVGLFAACDNDNDFPGIQTGTDGNSIILNISSASLPVSRASIPAEGAEVAVSHIDVLIFDDTPERTKVWSDRMGATTDKSGVITLPVKRETFGAGEAYWVYLIANSTHAKTDFDNLTDLAGLKGMTQADKNIHMTGLAGLTDVPMTFLMDGIAYPEGETEPVGSPAPVILYDGQKTNDTELAVSLRRAAVKVVFTLNKGPEVTFDNSDEAAGAGYYLRNMPYSTSVLPADQTFSADLRTTDKNSASYFQWSSDRIVVTAYMYAHSWLNESSFEQEPRLVVNIPMKYKNEADVRPDNYYQIPLCKDKVLNRNTCYRVTATVNAPGAENPSNPATLTDISYSVVDWDIETIHVGGNDDRPAYLTLNQYDMEMHNMEDDNTTLIFTSSSNVTASVVEAYYYDKFGQETEVLEDIMNQITAIPDPNLTGNIKIDSPNPTNNTIRYIVVEVKNQDGNTRTVTVEQYPLEYITNIQSWYSYRSDFGGTNWENKGNRNVGATNYNKNTNTWGYSTLSPGFFGSKVSTQTNADGTSEIYYYIWGSNNSQATAWNKESSLNNARIYYVRITATSGEYTLGRPRITDDKTDPGKDNAKLVSPSFMIASQLGGTNNSYLGSVYEDGIAMAASHCEQYVETYIDEKTGEKIHLSDWRLPTTAELEIISKFQKLPNSAIDMVLTGRYYYSASEIVDLGEGIAGASIRCIRDAYDDKK